MKRSDGFYWSTQATTKGNFYWNADNFNNPVRIRKELAKFNKCRECNVSIIEIIKIFLKGLFK